MLNDRRPSYASHRNKRLKLEELESRMLFAGDLTWSPPEAFSVGDDPWDVSAGDLNGDGNTDLAVGNFGELPTGGDISILMGRGDGTFEDEVRYEGILKTSFIEIGDLNGDQLPDVVAGNLGARPPSVSVLLNNGDGSSPSDPTDYAVGGMPSQATIADMNNDGKVDLIVSVFGDVVQDLHGNVVQLLQGNGDGTFGDATTIGEGIDPSALTVGDFNGDNFNDVAFANRKGHSVSVLLGNGDATFVDGGTYAIGPRPTSIASGDLNLDGELDLIAAISTGRDISVLYGEGDGTFAAENRFRAGRFPSDVVLADWDGDGDLDVAAMNWRDVQVSILLNDGHASFADAVEVRLDAFEFLKSSGRVTAADLDNNGAPDLIGTTKGLVGGLGRVSVVLNETDVTPGPIAGLMAGDANRDGSFDQLDFVQVLQSGKYLTGLPANWSEGDWNGDGVFDQNDVIMALAARTYLAPS